MAEQPLNIDIPTNRTTILLRDMKNPLNRWLKQIDLRAVIMQDCAKS
jgi:hypothetical protein